MNGRSNMSNSSHLVSDRDGDPTTSCVQVQEARTANRAVPVTEEVPGCSTGANTSVSEMKVVQTLQRQRLNTPLVSTPDNPAVMDKFSLPHALSRRNVAISGPTTLDGHSRNWSGFPENASSSPIDGVPKIASIEFPTTVPPPSSRITGEPHEVSRTREKSVPRTPAGFNTAAHLDVSNITSPADTLSGQSRHANGGSHTEAQPSSSKRESKARTVNSDRRSRKASRNGSSKQVKEKPKLVTPLEYAQKLQSCLDLHVKTNYLKGKCVFYVGGDMMYAGTTTRGRMEYVSRLSFSHCHPHPRVRHARVSLCGIYGKDLDMTTPIPFRRS